MDERYWLVTTEHLVDRLWFKDELDFAEGMNALAVSSFRCGVVVFAFNLMSNHSHSVVGGERVRVERYINSFKRLHSRYMTLKYGGWELLRENGVDIRELSLHDESFERAIAYVQMNPVAANITLNPEGYPWGTGNCFFNISTPAGRKASEFSGRELARILHFRETIPDDYIIDSRGFIDPRSYVRVDVVESVFRTPKRMNYYLSSSSKAKFMKEVPSFEDQVVSMAAKSLCVSLFRKGSMGELIREQASELLKQLRYRFSADPKQLARVTGLQYPEVCAMLDSV